MIIDSHFHLEPERFPISRLLSAMDAAGIDKTALIASICPDIIEPPAPLLALMRQMLQTRLTRAMVRLLLTRFSPEGNLTVPGGSATINRDPENAPVFAAASAHPDRFFAWVFVNPNGRVDPVTEWHRWANHPACIGVKTHPFWHRYPPKDLIPVATAVATKGFPLLMHQGFGSHGDIIPLLNAVPDLTLILAHAGFPDYAATWERIADRPQVFVDLSCTAYVDKTITKKALDTLGPDRCLFGTDGPFGETTDDGTFDYQLIKTRLETLVCGEEAQKKLLGKTFLDLTGKGVPP